MGTMQATLTAYASLSNHNSEQDDADRIAWAAFARAVRDLAKQPAYAEIRISVNASDEE